MLSIEPYSLEHEKTWDTFIEVAWNGTFIETRRYLNYHGTRFKDLSLIIKDHNHKWVGVFPAAQSLDDEHMVVSHPGLSYGGVIHAGQLRGAPMVEAMEKICQLYSQSGYASLVYKTIPHIYHRYVSEDDQYALFRAGAQVYRQDLLSSVFLPDSPPVFRAVTQQVRQMLSQEEMQIDSGVQYLPDMWEILNAQLQQRHHVHPVHSLSEIEWLCRHFPSNIHCTVVLVHDVVMSAAVTYRAQGVVHDQYLTSTEAGRLRRTNTLLIHHLISHARSEGFDWFDFGNSNEVEGQILNEGLYRFKEKFGASGVVQPFYKIAL